MNVSRVYKFLAALIGATTLLVTDLTTGDGLTGTETRDVLIAYGTAVLVYIFPKNSNTPPV